MHEPGVVVHACHPRTQETEAEASLGYVARPYLKTDLKKQISPQITSDG